MTPDRGDILQMKGNHFCLVVSPREFNARFKLAMVCPISAGAADVARSAGFLVSLMGHGLRTDGQVHAHQVKSLDWTSRQATFVESAPEAVVQEVLDCLQSIFEC